MTEYRLYLLNAASHITDATDLEAEDDDEALQLVRIRQEPSDCELWCGKRNVALIPRGGPPVLHSSEA